MAGEGVRVGQTCRLCLGANSASTLYMREVPGREVHAFVSFKQRSEK